MNQRRFSLPDDYGARIESLLRPLGFSLEEPKELAAAVLKLSDYYTQNPDAATPWQETWAQAASLAYYFPLNYARNRAVAIEGLRLGFFEGLESAADFGAGMGAALHAFSDILGGGEGDAGSLRFTAYDVSRDALALVHGLSPDERKVGLSTEVVAHSDLAAMGKRLPKPDTRLLIASYVLTELPALPKSWQDSEALAIVEPSTQDDARRLMQVRSDLMEAGFKVWAPCTHQGPCPLLVHSEKDWCHDRIHWLAPAWFEALEKNLPMKNRTLTFSYLLARRSLGPPSSVASHARLTGDMLVEKGKTRQSICRGPEREFLAWFPQRMKRDESIDLARGSLVRLGQGLEKKSAEIRLKAPADIEEIPPESDPGR